MPMGKTAARVMRGTGGDLVPIVGGRCAPPAAIYVSPLSAGAVVRRHISSGSRASFTFTATVDSSGLRARNHVILAGILDRSCGVEHRPEASSEFRFPGVLKEM